MKASPETAVTPLAVIGVDIGKEVFHLVGFGADGKIAFEGGSGDWRRGDVLPPCIVGMEACLSAHFVSRALRAFGHKPRIIPAIYVKPFVKGQKNDYNDAEAIAEAALRPNLRFVQEKSQDQLDLQPCSGVCQWRLLLGLREMPGLSASEVEPYRCYRDSEKDRHAR
jgi:transposase